jgi:hypothetical protein
MRKTIFQKNALKATLSHACKQKVPLQELFEYFKTSFRVVKNLTSANMLDVKSDSLIDQT